MVDHLEEELNMTKTERLLNIKKRSVEFISPPKFGV